MMYEKKLMVLVCPWPDDPKVSTFRIDRRLEEAGSGAYDFCLEASIQWSQNCGAYDLKQALKQPSLLKYNSLELLYYCSQTELQCLLQ